MTTARMLTPAGRGAIAVVEVVGPEAAGLVERWFEPAGGKALQGEPPNTIRFGRWRRADGAVGEEIVVIPTASDRVEVHCHGGAAAPAAILNALRADGAQPGAETPKSLTNQARRALAQAPTERTAGILLDQLNGALERALGEILTATESGDHAGAEAALRRLIDRERLGLRLTAPWRVVLAGPPNVGKSSLVNALVGYDRALVYDRPGTTRDVVTAAAAIDGWPVTLADTAGVRESDDPLEAAGVELTRRTLAAADAVVVVQEASSFAEPGANAFREALAASIPGVHFIEVANKVDQLASPEMAPHGAVPTSAATGAGIDTLRRAIGAALAIEPVAAGAAVPFEAAHFVKLREALAARPAARGGLLRALLAGERVCRLG